MYKEKTDIKKLGLFAGLFVSFGLFFASNKVIAGDAIPISFGDTVLGSIDPIGDTDTFTFSANAGDSVLIRMSYASGFLDPQVRLYGPDGKEVASGWDYSNVEVSHVLPSDGQYTILACDYGGTDTGDYGIFVQRLDNPGNATAINFGQTISGSIDSVAQMDTYTFSASAGDSVLIRMSHTSAFLDPQVRLYGPDGKEVASGWDYSNVEVSHVLPSDGQYTVLACDHGGTDTGNYTLSLSMQIVEQLTPGAPYDGNISTGNWHLFYVEVEAGKNLLVNLEPTSSTAILELYGRFGQAPSQSDCDYVTKKKNIFGNYELLISPTESGTYYFAVFGKDIVGATDYQITASTVNQHISDIYPRTAASSIGATVHIVGLGFTNGMQVELRGPGSSNILAETVVVSSSTMIIARFDLSGAPLGLYNIFVIWPDGYEKMIEGAIEVKELQEGALYAFDINIEKGSTVTYDIVVQEGTQNLFVTLQKTTLVSYGNSWRGTLSLLRDGGQIASASGSHDLILHIVNPASGEYTVKIAADQAGSGILIVWATLPELPLGDWVVGKIFCSYGSIWYQVDVPPEQDKLYFEAEAMGAWSHFDIYYGQYGSSNRWTSHQGTQTSFEIADPNPGTYIVEFLDSAMIYAQEYGYGGYSEDQSRDVLIKADTTFTVEPPPDYLPTITSISIDKGGNTGLVTVEIRGGWLDPNTTVALVSSGFEDIIAQSVSGDPECTTLTATFDLTDKEPGEYNLTVTNPDGQSTTAPSPFTVEEGREPELWVEIIGREKIRARRSARYILRYGNSGDIDAGDSVLTLRFPDGLDYDCDIPLVRGTNSEAAEDMNGYTHIFIWLPHIAAGEYQSFDITLYSSSSCDATIQAGIVSLEQMVHLLIFNDSPPERLGERPYAHATVDANPKPGDICFRYSKDKEGTGHVGTYVEVDGKGYVIDMQSDGKLYFTSFDEWKGQEGGLAKPGFGSPSDMGDLGGAIAEKALETYQNWVKDGSKPYKFSGIIYSDEIWNCVKFVTEIYKEAGYTPDWGNWYPPGAIFKKLFPDKDWEAKGMWRWLADEEFIKSLYDDPDIIELIFAIAKAIQAVDSTTPEDKYGPSGFDPLDTPPAERERFVPEDRNIYYKVDFWNKEDATAPACDVLVKDRLASNLDWNSFSFEKIGFLKWDVELEPCQYFNLNVNTRPDMDLIVNVEGTFDLETGEITWTFKSLDPATMETPEDPMAGFLPPISESGEEIGWVEFSVEPKDDLTSGTQVSNQAFVEFDWAGDLLNHPAPKEGPWTNTLDAGVPTSQVEPLPEKTMEIEFTVEWTGQDDTGGSGIAGYDIYVSIDSNEYTLWLGNTADTNAVFTGEVDHTYSFYSRARDNVGYTEPAPDSPDSTISVQQHIYHAADTSGDYVIGISEIVSYINDWAAGEVSISDVVKAINLWAAGHYYWDSSEQKFKPGTQP